MMKILQISSQVPVPETDGGKISIFGVTKSLHKLGYEIDFVCYLKNADYDKSIELMKKYCTPHLLKVNTENNIWGAIKNLFSAVPYNASKYRKKELKEYIGKLLRQKKFDIIQVEHLHMGWIVDYIKKEFPGIPVTLREQNLETKIMQRFYQKEKNKLLKLYSYIQYKKFTGFEPETCAKFNSCIMISEDDEKELLKLNGNIKTVTIPAGVNESLLSHPIEKKEEKKIVHVGNLDWYPNLDGLNWFLKEVFPEVVKKNPDIKLYIYGGGDFNKLTINNAVKNNVELVGFVDDLWQNLNDKSLAIVPLRIGGGIRIKILEMMAYGINILTTELGKEGIDVEDNKQIFIADNGREFINKTIDILEGKYNNVQIAERGRNFIAENYTWEKIGEKFERHFKSLLKN